MSKQPIWQVAAAMLVIGNAEFGYATNEISRFVICSGGGRATSANHEVIGTVGQAITGLATSVSTNHVLEAGFWNRSAGTPTSVDDGGASPTSVPLVFRLDQNVPNPFNPTTSISFTLAEPGRTTLRIFDLGGRVVTTLLDADMNPGRHVVPWDGRNDNGLPVASGTYFYQLRTHASAATGRMSLIK